MEWIKKLIAVIGGLIATAAKMYGLILIFVCVAIVMDVITGIVKTKALGQKLSSEKGRRGFFKKVTFILALTFGIFIDAFIPSVLQIFADVTLPFNCPFGLIVGIYIVLNESISICENLFTANPQAVPKWLKPFFENLSEKIDEGGNENE